MSQLAEQLVALGSSQRPIATDMLQDICQGLSDLPEHLLARVFKAAARHNCGVHALLKVSPRHLHTAILATSITPKKKMTACFSNAPTAFLRALSALPSSPPSVLSLRIRYLTNVADDHGAAEPTMFMLSNALRHHSALQHLTFDRCCAATRSATHLAPAVATLTSLQSLTLGSHDDCCSCHDLPNWQTALHLLPQLKDIKLHLHNPVNPKKRQREESPTATKPSPFCLTSMLAASTNLSSLALHIKPHTTAQTSPPHLRALTATAPLVLPHLIHLTLTGCWLAAAGPLLNYLRAPLTSLVLTRLNTAFLSCRDTDPDPAFIFRGLSTHTGLSHLQFDIPMCVRRSSTADWWHTLTAAAASGLHHLRSLRDLHLKAGVRTLLCTAPAALSAATDLHRLQISCRCSGHGHGCVPSWTEWTEFLRSLCVPSVHELRLWMPHVPCDHIPGPARLLRCLSALTCLRLTGYDNCLATTDDLAALSELTRLKHLSIHEFSMPDTQHAEFVQALLPLTGLTHLSLTGGSLCTAFATAFHANAGALVSMQQLRIGIAMFNRAAEAVVRGAAAMPALRQVTLFAGGSSGDLDAWEFPHEVPKADSVLLPVAEVEALAARLGVALLCDSGPELRTLSP